MAKKKKKKLNKFTEKEMKKPKVIVKEEEEIEENERIGEVILPGSKGMVPVTGFAMPVATVEQVQTGVQRIKELFNALVSEGDIVMIENRPHGKKSAINKINRFCGISTEVLRSFQEEHVATRDYWSKGFKKVILVHRGEKYLICKAWVKAILPNGQFSTRGGAVSETERRFAHTPHDLMATAETRAMKNACANLVAFIDFELMENEENEEPEKKTYKPKPSQEQGFKHSAVTRPEMPASLKQKEYINAIIGRIKTEYETETKLEKPVEQLNKGEAANLIEKLLAKGKELKRQVKMEIPKEEPPDVDEGGMPLT